MSLILASSSSIVVYQFSADLTCNAAWKIGSYISLMIEYWNRAVEWSYLGSSSPVQNLRFLPLFVTHTKSKCDIQLWYAQPHIMDNFGSLILWFLRIMSFQSKIIAISDSSSSLCRMISPLGLAQESFQVLICNVSFKSCIQGFITYHNIAIYYSNRIFFLACLEGIFNLCDKIQLNFFCGGKGDHTNYILWHNHYHSLW